MTIGKPNDQIEYFIRLLLDGTCQLTQKEAKKICRQYSIFKRKPCCQCLALSWKETKADYSVRIGQAILLKEKTAEALLEKHVEGYTCVMDDLTVGLVIAPGKGSRDIAAMLLKWFPDHQYAPIRIGIGKAYESITDMYYSKEEALEALFYDDTEDIVSIGEILSLEPSWMSDFGPRIKYAVSLFSKGAIGEMTEELKKLAEDVRRNTNKAPNVASSSSIRYTMNDFILRVIRISEDAGVDTADILQGEEPRKIIFRFRSTPEIIDWIAQVCTRLYGDISKQRESIQQRIIGRANDYIDAHLSETTLCLTDVCAFLSLSEGYFSSIWNKTVNISLPVYINQKRVNAAIPLLTQSNKPIRQISEECGFLSPNYFSSVFRKITNLSPSEYRNERR